MYYHYVDCPLLGGSKCIITMWIVLFSEVANVLSLCGLSGSKCIMTMWIVLFSEVANVLSLCGSGSVLWRGSTIERFHCAHVSILGTHGLATYARSAFSPRLFKDHIPSSL